MFLFVIFSSFYLDFPFVWLLLCLHVDINSGWIYKTSLIWEMFMAALYHKSCTESPAEIWGIKQGGKTDM